MCNVVAVDLIDLVTTTSDIQPENGLDLKVSLELHQCGPSYGETCRTTASVPSPRAGLSLRCACVTEFGSPPSPWETMTREQRIFEGRLRGPWSRFPRRRLLRDGTPFPAGQDLGP